MTSPTITFDRLAYIDRLKEAGFDDRQARAQADALDAALRDSVATKADIAELKTEIALAKAELRAEIAIVKSQIATGQWLIGGVGFGVLLLVLKSFWPN